MKSEFLHHSFRDSCWRKPGASRVVGQRGVALVITLILLAVITTLAIAFLALTSRETNAVDAMGRTTDAELAADSALERARSEILAPFIFRNRGNNNGTEVMGPDFMVSVAWDTNRLSSMGLLKSPSPPVFADTNRGTTGPFEDRHYLDLNRNRYFEDTGYVQVTDDNFLGIAGLTNWLVGDPQWIGILQDPRRPHTNDNRFIARYAFMIQPIGRSLDVNWIHNDIKFSGTAPAPGTSGYFRNQGVAPFECNLAAFFCDLNANMWNAPAAPYGAVPYSFGNLVTANRGTAFEDAWQLLSYRCSGNRNLFDNMGDLFANGIPAVRNDVLDTISRDGIDSYLNDLTVGGPDNDDANVAWPGSDSRRKFFGPHDYFDRSKLGAKPANGRDFVDRLTDVSQIGNSYDRYTYYRMLAQLGTDSAEEQDKININYVNIRSWVPNSTFHYKASDLVSWTNNTPAFVTTMGRPGPELFFLTVVTNLLVREPALAFIVTNNFLGTPLRIPILTNANGVMISTSSNLPLPGPLYAGRVHQILQLAANIYDATTGSKGGEPLPYFPSIFRPRFMRVGAEIFIVDYNFSEEPATELLDETRNPWWDIESGEGVNISTDVPTGPARDFVYGIPLIIGARKGFPNFNEIGVLNSATATRKLTIYRAVSNTPVDKIEQEFSLKAVTKLQVEARNAYGSAYPRPMQLQIRLRTGLQVTNSNQAFPYRDWTRVQTYTYAAGQWPGTIVGSPETSSANYSNYVVSPLFETNIIDWQTNTLVDKGGFTNWWSATVTNRLRFYIIDTSVTGGRIIDAVTLNRPHKHFEIGRMMEEDLPESDLTLRQIWNNGLSGEFSVGVRNQLGISQNPTVGLDRWGNYDLGIAKSRDEAALNFRQFYQSGDKGPAGTNQSPFTPTRVMVQADYFQVNDPLVHYNFEDLREDLARKVNGTEPYNGPRTNLAENIGIPNRGLVGWNGGEVAQPGSEILRDPTVRDPGVIHPELWNFPTNKFPSVGWLGRVHRGTPWQTIYLKSRETNQDWRDYSGNQRNGHSANIIAPRRDWELLDIFSTAPYGNSSRGQLSVNQTNLAAWSAVLSGALSSVPEDSSLDPGKTIARAAVIEPAALAVPVQQIVNGINLTRTLFNSNQFNPFGQFTRLSQFLAVPELTDLAPHLNSQKALFEPLAPEGNAEIFDEDYERIPQQILSLVKVGEPRFVVYAWGQSLKPARRNPENTGPSIETAGADKGLVRNYQVTGETATRAVIRVEFDRFPNGQFDYSRPHAVVESFNVVPVD